MIQDHPLKGVLDRWELRLGLVESAIWALWGLAAGLCAGLLTILAARMWPLATASQLAQLAAFLGLVGAALGPAIVWLRPRSVASSARVFDRCFGLAERLVTAVEIEAGDLQVAPAMSAAQLADTLRAAAGVVPREMLPLRFPRPALLILGVTTVILAFALWLPNPQEDVLLQQAAVRAAIEEQIAELEAVRDIVAEASGLTEAEREEMLQVLDEAIAAMEEGRATPLEAVAALSEAEQALMDLRDPGAALGQAGLEDAGEEMADSEYLRDVAEALADGDYQRAAGALAAYAGEEGDALTRDEQLALALELVEAAEILAESNPELSAQLAQAAEAIERGDTEGARNALQEAAEEMAEVGKLAERHEAVEGVLAELQEGREAVAEAGGAGDSVEEAGTDGQQTQPGHHEDTGSGAPYDEVYVPRRLGEDGTPVEIESDGNGGAPGGEAPFPSAEVSSQPSPQPRRSDPRSLEARRGRSCSSWRAS